MRFVPHKTYIPLMLRNIFKTAWRNLLRHRVNTTINVLGLALGITVCLIIFLLVK
jgi:putative ABC transport system permease protein